MKFNTIIFDLDGTILDTLEDLADSINMMLEHKGYALRSIDEVREFLGEGYRRMIERALPRGAAAKEVDSSVEVFRNFYNENMVNKTKPYAGVVALMQELKNMGLRIGVVSNKMEEATKRTCNHYFGDLVDVVIGDTPGRRRKPAPDNVYEAMKLLGAEHAKTIFVGDSQVDVQTAKNAGLVCVGVSWGFRKREILIAEGADYIIDEPEELLDIVS